jgi:hypothetical protein
MMSKEASSDLINLVKAEGFGSFCLALDGRNDKNDIAQLLIIICSITKFVLWWLRTN